jgi:hypothetical protein
MEKTKLTLRIEQSIIESAKDYAEQHDTSLSRLVSEFLRSLRAPTDGPSAPILDELSGILPPDVSAMEYHRHLEEKYDRQG